MSKLIDEYFMKHLNLDQSEAFRLHQEYYKNYGLAIEGLVRHHEIDPLEYNRQVDDALPLEDILSPAPDLELRKLLEQIDKSKVKMWLFTNAYVNHGKRVVNILGIEDLFEGLTYCDYGANPLLCKPAEAMFRKAMREAGVEKMEDCWFIGMFEKATIDTFRSLTKILDDSSLNCVAAKKLGWSVAHLVEGSGDYQQPADSNAPIRLSSLQQLKDVFPQFFKKD